MWAVAGGGGRYITVERRQVIGLSDAVTAGLAVCVADGNISAILLEESRSSIRTDLRPQWPNQRGFPHRTPISGVALISPRKHGALFIKWPINWKAKRLC